MRWFISLRWLPGAAALVLAVLAFTPFTPREPACRRGRCSAAATTEGRPVSYLREVRPILAQHCFQCHGPDEAARKGKLRLDLKELAYAERDGLHVIAPGNLDES